MNNFHTPVLLKEITETLEVSPGRKYIDATFGGGGHTARILKLGGTVLGIDLDGESLEYGRKKFSKEISDGKLILQKGNFKEIDEIARLNNFTKVSAVIFDLGVSSHQIDTPERGFSFLRQGPLDMRMDKGSQITAEVLVNLLTKGELNDLFNRLGQEHRFRAISDGIVRSRRIKAIKTTGELSDIVHKAYGLKGEVSDFVKTKVNKKVFQALRIAVNGELENITEALPKAIDLLEEKGKIIVITFHSLEDGIVKKSFKDFEEKNMGKVITAKPILPVKEELNKNSRARSAKLRVFEKS